MRGFERDRKRDSMIKSLNLDGRSGGFPCQMKVLLQFASVFSLLLVVSGLACRVVCCLFFWILYVRM